jgi:hypothetical protein
VIDDHKKTLDLIGYYFIVKETLLAVLALALAGACRVQSEPDPLLLQQPTMSRTQIVFVYSGEFRSRERVAWLGHDRFCRGSHASWESRWSTNPPFLATASVIVTLASALSELQARLERSAPAPGCGSCGQ